MLQTIVFVDAEVKAGNKTAVKLLALLNSFDAINKEKYFILYASKDKKVK